MKELESKIGQLMALCTPAAGKKRIKKQQIQEHAELCRSIDAMLEHLPGAKNAHIVQEPVAETLLNLLKIRGNDDILDMGCGVGNLTKEIRDGPPHTGTVSHPSGYQVKGNLVHITLGKGRSGVFHLCCNRL